MIGNSYGDLQLRLFTIFQYASSQLRSCRAFADHVFYPAFRFIFVAPGVIAQVQPKFIANRDIFEAREKKAKIYSAYLFSPSRNFQQC